MKTTMEKIAEILRLKLCEEFHVRVSEYGKRLGCKLKPIEVETIYRFDTEFVYKGRQDGWDEWYGGNQHTFYRLCIGLYEVVKIKKRIKFGFYLRRKIE